MPTESSLYLALTTAGQIIKSWWWVVLPFIFWKPFKFLWLWWRIDEWLARQNFILLKIKIPKESVKPIRAMETVMASLHGVTYHPPDWWEKWIDGQVQLSLGLEIVSVGGETNFFIRTAAPYRQAVEASIYSQYPEAEIEEVDDYIRYVPQNLPNKEWNMFGADYKLLKDDCFPIKTYPKFETEHEVLEKKIIDPVATLLESMAKVKPGEQFWIQFSTEPVSEEPLKAWIKKAELIRDKLARRPEPPPPPKPILREATEILITGKVPGEEKSAEKEVIPPEMKLTPGEREIVAGLENKISKPVFSTTVRFIYLGKRDVFFKPNFRLAFAYFNSYTALNSNALFPESKTFTKIHKSRFLPLNFLIPRRHYLRCRKLFRNYCKRLNPFFPKSGGTYHLNTEELASLFHFPGEAVAPAPGVHRVEAKRGGGPSELPIE